jgi:hypothetical protein
VPLQHTSVKEVDWAARLGTKLGHLTGQNGFFHDSHHAGLRPISDFEPKY